MAVLVTAGYDVERGFRGYIAFLKTGNYKQLPWG